MDGRLGTEVLGNLREALREDKSAEVRCAALQTLPAVIESAAALTGEVFMHLEAAVREDS